VAEKLKSLFSFGVESTALLAVSALAEEKPPLLAAAALACLSALLTYNKMEAASGLPVPQYELLVQALLSDWLLPAPGLPTALDHLAAATTDDTNWMFLHYQLLLAQQDTRPSVEGEEFDHKSALKAAGSEKMIKAVNAEHTGCLDQVIFSDLIKSMWPT
jgi:hypothetical protein